MCERERALSFGPMFAHLNTELNLVVGTGLRSKCGSAGVDWFAFCGCVYWLVVLALLRSSAYARGSGGWWLDSPSVVPRSRCCKSGIISTQAVYALEQLNAAGLRLSYPSLRFCFPVAGSMCLVNGGILVDPASSHMLVSKIKPCMSKFTPLYGETANGSLNQSRFLR